MKLTPDLLLRAYALGIFPMAESREETEIHWIDPELRGILPLDQLHVPRRLKKELRQNRFQVTCNRAFPDVIQHCAEPAQDRQETWINNRIEKLYSELNQMGFAHSVECWQTTDDGQTILAGGLYGVSLGAAFFGESMFSRTKNASKIALVHLVLRLRKSGFLLLDTQFSTPHLRQFGVIDVPRDHYKALLSKALMQTPRLAETLSQEELWAGLNAPHPQSSRPG
jgi:leucyl/phenylalanyl-tRNA--protein transferase|tara:strand:+ start:282 stop:956 length:675 start_codon:yes stop_codon:yes gene_type:complete